MSIEQIKQATIPILNRYGVVRAGVFGSYARDEAGEDSDIDLLVKFDKAKSLLEIIRLEREISETLGKKIDLVTEPSLNKHIRDRVLNELKVYYERR
jgi:uncharacterized protein